MKKKIILFIVIIITLVLLVPIPFKLKDGGSIEFKALLYTVTKYHRLDMESETGFQDGLGIKILGMEVYNNLNKNEIHKAEIPFELIFNKTNDVEERTIIKAYENDKYPYNIFSYGGEVKIKINNVEYDLRTALLEGKITMEEIIEKANKDAFEDKTIKVCSLNDGGTNIYCYNDYTITKMHTLNGNFDVHITSPDIMNHY